jgi:hypothetical protein
MTRFASIIIVIVVLLQFGQDSQAQSKAGWALIDIQRDTSRIEKETVARLGKVEAISDSSAKVLLRYAGPSRGKYVSIASAHKWSEPPVVLKPGDELKINLGLEVRVLIAGWNAHHGTGTHFRVDLDGSGPAFSNTQVDKPVAVGGQINETFPTYKKVEESISWKVPAGRKTLVLTFGFASNTDGKVIYTYEWQEDPRPTVKPQQPQPGEDKLDENPPTTGKVNEPTDSPGDTKKNNNTTDPTADISGLTVRAATRRVKPGQAILAPVEILNPGGLANINVVIDYSAEVVSVSAKPSPGALKQNRLFEANHSESGIVRLGLAGADPLTSSGQMALIPFVAVGQPGTKSKLKVVVTNANSAGGEILTPTVIDGEIEILESGSRDPEDIDDDNEVTAKDALEALKMSVKLIPINSAADVDGDGSVTSNDARLILLRVVGK